MDDQLHFARRAASAAGIQPTNLPQSTGPGSREERRAARRVKRVLVLSHMFPHPQQPALGPFVLEQVRALRRYAKVDARVVCCLPFWVNSRNPFRYRPALRTYRQLLNRPHWTSEEDVPVMFLPYLVGIRYPHPVHARTYQEAVLGATPAILKKFAFEVVHAHTSYLDGSAGRALSQQHQVPLFITEHTSPFRRLTEDERIRRPTLAAIQAADRVWCVSRSLAEEVQAHFPARQDNLAVLGNGVDTAQFRPPARWLPDPARPRLLAIMSLEERKNPLLLLRAFQRLRLSAPGATLTLVGAGPLEEPIRAEIAAKGLDGCVRLPGLCCRQMVAELMREECDVLVLSSDQETFGVVLIEAMACGKPVVATSCGGPADVVTAPWLGRLCPPRDLEGMARALAEVVHGLPAFDGARIRQYALDRFDYRRLAWALCTEYDRVLARQDKPATPGRDAA